MVATVLDQPAAPPTMADAKAAADALLGEGVSWVMVFGSVARGEATEYSDIDLIAVYDDLDYSGRNRYMLSERLRTVAEAATGHDCGVVVTDRPEWHIRVANVYSSFEHAISKEAITLADTGPGDTVVWDKRQAKPVNNRQQSLQYLNNCVSPKLQELAMAMFNTYFSEEQGSNPAHSERTRLDRMRNICEHSSRTVELLVKTLVSLAGEHPISDKQMETTGHNIEICVKQLPAHLRNLMRTAIAQFGLSPPVLSTWKTLGTFPGDISTERAVADEWADDYARTAFSIAFSVLDEVERQLGHPHKTVSRIRRQVERMSDRFQKRDIHYNRPLDEPDPAKAPTVLDLSHTEFFNGPEFSNETAQSGLPPPAQAEREWARRLKRKGLGHKDIARMLLITLKQAQQHTKGMTQAATDRPYSYLIPEWRLRPLHET